MTPNPLDEAGLVEREVRSGSRDGTATRSVVARRTYATDQADLWHALTDAERLPRWFLPIEGDLRVGGRYQLEGNAGGTIQTCEEPDRFEVTWEYAEQVSWLTVTLTPTEAGTRLELIHEAPDDPAFWRQYGPGAGGLGWDLGLLGLALHLDQGQAVDPEVAQRWPTTPEGVAFVRRAADGWVAAAIADGDATEEANEAGEHSVAFYTVPPPA